MKYIFILKIDIRSTGVVRAREEKIQRLCDVQMVSRTHLERAYTHKTNDNRPFILAAAQQHSIQFYQSYRSKCVRVFVWIGGSLCL